MPSKIPFIGCLLMLSLIGVFILTSGKVLAKGEDLIEIKKDIDDGTRAGVTGTPTFFLGITGKDKQIKGGRIVGAQPFDIYKQQIEALLKKAASNGSGILKSLIYLLCNLLLDIWCLLQFFK